MPQPGMALTPAQVASFQSEGFIALPALLPAALTERLRREMDRLAAHAGDIAPEDTPGAPRPGSCSHLSDPWHHCR
jgi:hypothetical protein